MNTSCHAHQDLLLVSYLLLSGRMRPRKFYCIANCFHQIIMMVFSLCPYADQRGNLRFIVVEWAGSVLAYNHLKPCGVCRILRLKL